MASWPRLIFDTAHKRALTDADYARAGIAERLRDCELSKIPKDAEYRAHVESYIKNLDQHLAEGNGLFLAGLHGGGKSGAAIVIAKEVMARGGSVLFLEEFALIDAILTGREFSDDVSMRERMGDVHLLVIDDLGLAPVSGNLHVTEEVIKHRLQRRKPVVLTTNLLKDAFKERYPTIADALREACFGVVCNVKWRDVVEQRLKEKFKK
jgi:DNA replication protein DnaC